MLLDINDIDNFSHALLFATSSAKRLGLDFVRINCIKAIIHAKFVSHLSYFKELYWYIFQVKLINGSWSFRNWRIYKWWFNLELSQVLGGELWLNYLSTKRIWFLNDRTWGQFWSWRILTNMINHCEMKKWLLFLEWLIQSCFMSIDSIGLIRKWIYFPLCNT